MTPLDGSLQAAASGEPRTLADRAFAAIHDAIVGGQLEPGERLPIEDLAEALNMSPMPIREALRRLDGVGLVEHVPHRGARVADLSIEDLREIYDARMALEALALRRAAERHEQKHLDEAREALASLEKGRPRSGIWLAHQRFHFALYEGAQSRWLLRLIAPLWESSERYRVSIVRKGPVDMRQAEHESMLEAVAAGDADGAAVLARDHLAQTANDVAAKMGHDQELFPLERV
jgi:DNA-binding GntR family transcriptional regulator